MSAFFLSDYLDWASQNLIGHALSETGSKKAVSFVSVICFCVSVASAVPTGGTADVSGVWAMTFQTPQGDMTSDVTFVQEGEAIKVTMLSPDGMEMKGEGTVKENDIQWVFTISAEWGDFTIGFKGKGDGYKRTGEAEMGEYGTAAWTAEKKK